MSAGAAGACPRRGGQLRFRPASGHLACLHCGEVSAGGRSASTQLPQKQPLASAAAAGAEIRAAALACRACGAGLGADPALIALDCPFCGGALVRDDRTVTGPAPSATVSFAVGEAEARCSLADYLSGEGLPAALRGVAAENIRLTGVYLSFYLVDLIVRSHLRLRGGWMPGARGGPEAAVGLDDVLVPACETLGLTEDAASHGRTAWDLSALRPWDPGFLLGFRAAMPAIGADEALARAGWMLRRRAPSLRAVQEDAPFRPVRHRWADRLRVDGQDARAAVVLLPVWIGLYRADGSVFRVTVNGQTGRVAAEAPVEPWNRAIMVAIFVIALGLFAATVLA